MHEIRYIEYCIIILQQIKERVRKEDNALNDITVNTDS